MDAGRGGLGPVGHRMPQLGGRLAYVPGDRLRARRRRPRAGLGPCGDGLRPRLRSLGNLGRYLLGLGGGLAHVGLGGRRHHGGHLRHLLHRGHGAGRHALGPGGKGGEAQHLLCDVDGLVESRGVLGRRLLRDAFALRRRGVGIGGIGLGCCCVRRVIGRAVVHDVPFAARRGIGSRSLCHRFAQHGRRRPCLNPSCPKARAAIFPLLSSSRPFELRPSTTDDAADGELNS